VVEKNGIEADFIKVTNYNEIADMGFMSTPDWLSMESGIQWQDSG
jgi:hypothetical protein